MLLVRLGGERWDYKKFIKHISFFFTASILQERVIFLKRSSVFVDFFLKCLFILLVQSCDMMALRVRHHFFF